MRKYNPQNERIKRQYLGFLKEAKRQNEASIDAVAKALSRYEAYTKYRDFKAFHHEQAVGFKKYLAKQSGKQSGEQLSKSTMHSTLRHLKNFFQWLAMQPGYKSKINYTDTEYFNLSEKDTRIATAKRNKPVPTLEQVKHVLNTMPNNTVLEKRNRSLIAFTLLTGIRDSAIASLKLKHIDLSNDSVFQDAREVKTKFSKTLTTYFFPVGSDIRQIVDDWVHYLKNDLPFGNDDPLFPKTKVEQNTQRIFEPTGVTKEHWSTATPIRTIFREAFNTCDLQYFNPHSFRKTLVSLGEKLCQTPEEFKSWSQNLGHEGVLTTLYSYGEVQPERQSEIFQQLKTPKKEKAQDVGELARAIAKEMKNSGVME